MKKRGWRVFATVRNNTDKQRLKNEGLEAVILDYTDSKSITECADHVLRETGGRLDALFNNGAYGQIGAVEDLNTDVLRAQFETNFFGWHELTLKFLPAMRAAGHGRIVQCSSILGLVSMKYRGAYSSSKFALESLSDTMRMELEGTGIYVSLIEPGPIKSRFVARTIEVFESSIDRSSSPYQQDYDARMVKMKSGGTSRFKQGPEEVQKRLVHAVEHDNPRPRYYVTTPTYVMGLLKRILTHRAMDRFLSKRAKDELK